MYIILCTLLYSNTYFLGQFNVCVKMHLTPYIDVFLTLSVCVYVCVRARAVWLCLMLVLIYEVFFSFIRRNEQFSIWYISIILKCPLFRYIKVCFLLIKCYFDQKRLYCSVLECIVCISRSFLNILLFSRWTNNKVFIYPLQLKNAKKRKKHHGGSTRNTHKNKRETEI